MKCQLKKIWAILSDKYKMTIILAQRGFYNKMPDKKFLELQHKNVFGYKPDWKNPVTYSEKLQWLKLYDRKPEYVKLVDKYTVKKYVASIIGSEYIIPTLGVWKSFEDIDFKKLPNQFVLKCTHDSGGNVICTDKSKFDIKAARKKINTCLARNYYIQSREWPYKNVKRRIIAEKYMVDESGYELKDYKFFCFNGEPKAVMCIKDRTDKNKSTKYNFYDENFKHLPLNGKDNSEILIKRPPSLEQMKEYAKLLSKGFPHIRVDFYDINGKLYFGELTFFHHGGFETFEPPYWNKILGSWIKLPEKYNN